MSTEKSKSGHLRSLRRIPRETGVSRRDLQALAPRLEEARREVLDDDCGCWPKASSPGKGPAGRGILRAAGEDPGRVQGRPEEQRTGRILTTARRLQDTVDRVVVLGIGGSYMGARALLEACCEPYFNELDRGAARQPAADVLRGQQRRQRRLARTAQAAGPRPSGGHGRRPLGDRRDQQERRHAGNGRRVSPIPGRLEAIGRRRCPETGPTGRAGHGHQR